MSRARLTGAFALAAALSTMAGVAQAQRIQMPVGYRLTWIGARWQVDATVVDGNGRPLAAPLTYRIADPEVASVSARGEVIARSPGHTRLWAVTGRDSASALIVVEQWPARFSFTPAAVRLEARNATQPLRVLASDSAGVPIVGGTTRVGLCRSVNERVARLTDGNVVAVANGSTWIRCSDRGIADSIRVDVRQRVTQLNISNRVQLARARTPGDTFSVRVKKNDARDNDVPDARPTWASLNPSVVSIDPVSGRARAVGGGEARVIVQVGDVADSVSISVTGAPAQPLAVATAAVISDSGPRSRVSLTASELFAYEAETTYVDIAAFDTAGTRVDYTNPGVTFRIVDTTIAARLSDSRIVTRRAGQTQVIVRWAGLVDTAVLNVLPRTAMSSGSAAAESEARSAFRTPTIPDSSAQHLQARANIDRVIHTDPVLGARRQNLVVVTNVTGSFAEHLSRTETGTIEDRTGPLYGGTGTLLLYQKIELMGTLRLGSLTSVDTLGENLKVTEFEGSAGLFPVQQFGLRAGVVLRGKRTDLATQTAMIPKVTLVSRFSFIGDVFNTYAAFSLFPMASFSNIPERGSLFSRGGEVGLEFRLVRTQGLNGGLTYIVEQIAFDESPRLESISSIRLRFGLNIGR